LPYVVLAAPFVIGIALLDGLTSQIQTFHYTDERSFHLPTIQQFAAHWPTPDLTTYRAAQTPLYHWLMAGVVEAAGYHVWLLRLLSALFAYATAIVLYRLLVRRGITSSTACGLALLFLLSPYVFGVSFLAMTDSLGLLFVVLAISRLDAFRSDRAQGSFAAFLAWMCLAILTRQSAAWLALAGFAVLLLVRSDRRAILSGTLGLVAALVPLAALVVSWGGLVPKGSDATSCGLCKAGVAGAGLTLRSTIPTLGLIAVYAIGVLGPSLLGQLARLRAMLAPALGAGGVVALGLLLEPTQRASARDAGYLWKLAGKAPELDGTSLVFWLLVPLGAGLAYLLARRALPDPFPAVVVGAFLVSTLVVRLPYQKYFDPFALLFVLLATRPGLDLLKRWQWGGVGLLAVAFATYALSF